MKRSAVLLLTMCVLVAGCDDDNGDNGPSDQPLVFTANMTAAQETTPVGGGEQNATGTATVTITPTRDGSTITGGTAQVQFTVQGLTSSSNIILAHVHTGAAGVAGPPVINSGLSAGSAIPTPAGSASFDRSGLTFDNAAAVINAIVANPAGYYFNVHTTGNPGGVVRGQLQAQ